MYLSKIVKQFLKNYLKKIIKTFHKKNYLKISFVKILSKIVLEVLPYRKHYNLYIPRI